MALETARDVTGDYLHNMRFHVNAANGPDGKPRLEVLGRPQAGFSAVTTPEISVEAMEYREGQHIYTMKFPGNPTFSDVTLSRGVARQDSSFLNWIRQVVEGSGNYRTTLSILHFHRIGALTQKYPSFGSAALSSISTERPQRTYKLYNAFPIRHKIAGDLDATSSDVSIMEIDVAYEWFDLDEGGAG